MSLSTNKDNKFQIKIQTEINLADDELNRLELYYKQLQSEIQKIQNVIQNYQRENIHKENHSKKISQIKTLNSKIYISKIRSQHASKIKTIQELQNREVEQMQKDFESSLLEIQNWEKNLIIQKTSSLDKEISQIQELLSQQTQSNNENDSFYDSSDDTINFDKRKMDILEERTQNITHSHKIYLRSLHNKLKEFQNTAVRENNKHLRIIQNKQKLIDNLNSSYNTKVHDMNARHQVEINEYNAQLTQIENQIKSFQEAQEKRISKIDTLIQNTVSQNTLMSSEIRSSFSHYSSSIHNSTDDTQMIFQNNEMEEIENARSKLEEAQICLQEKENTLMELRTTQESLIREIKRVQHENELSKRYMKLLC